MQNVYAGIAMKTIAFFLTCAACCAQTVTIVNSGSTNTAGFQIVVEKSGEAEYTARPRRFGFDKNQAPKTIQKTIPKSLAERLYSDVDAARPLASLPPRHCMKSASFGTRLTLQAGDDESPDLSCGDGGSAKLKALIGDAREIVKIFQPE
jgi:hypothetical protein